MNKAEDDAHRLVKVPELDEGELSAMRIHVYRANERSQFALRDLLEAILAAAEGKSA